MVFLNNLRFFQMLLILPNLKKNWYVEKKIRTVKLHVLLQNCLFAISDSVVNTWVSWHKIAKFKKLKETWMENRSSNNGFQNSKINYSQNVNKNTCKLSGCTNRLHTVYVQIMILYDSVISRIWKGHINMINDVLKGYFSLLKRPWDTEKDNCIISRLDR